jgi:hypothetical protein
MIYASYSLTMEGFFGSEFVDDCMNGWKYIRKLIINYYVQSKDNTVQPDERYQLFFTKDSLVYKAIYNIFLRHNLFNLDKEVLDKISKVIGGSKVQDPHGDFQRVCVQTMDGNGHLNVVHEIGREQYNRAMDSPYAYSTIMFGLSNLPFHISVPSS